VKSDVLRRLAAGGTAGLVACTLVRCRPGAKTPDPK
jgi:hypothetical protein